MITAKYGNHQLLYGRLRHEVPPDTNCATGPKIFLKSANESRRIDGKSVKSLRHKKGDLVKRRKHLVQVILLIENSVEFFQGIH